jgi:predicted nuclease of restriction endonuclease-like (RecB) superfamily
MQGFSRRNLYRMRAVYLAYRDASEFVPQVVAQIPWGHNIMVLEKLKDPDERLWYIQQTIQYGWSRNVLRHHIETRLYQRQAKAEKSTNFAATLPPPHSDLVEQTIKDEYIFDFLTLREGAHERELERALVERIRDFLLELGSGFAFLGSQYHLEVGGQDFYIDLLFYQFGKEDLAVEGEDEFAAADRRLHCITTKHRIECRQYDWASAWKLKSLRARPTMRLFETLARAFGKGVLPVKVRTLNERINIEFVVR